MEDDGGLNRYRKFVSGTARKIGQWMPVPLSSERYLTQQVVFLMFRREVIEGADLQPIELEDIMVQFLQWGPYKKVVEIAHKFQQRTEGVSKLSR